MASSGLVILLLVGIIFMVANAVKTKTQELNGQEPNGEHPDPESKVKVVYKYLPLDLDTYYRMGDMHTPSKLYYSMFNYNENDLTQQA